MSIDPVHSPTHNCGVCGTACNCRAGNPHVKGICEHCPPLRGYCNCNPRVDSGGRIGAILAAVGAIRQDLGVIKAILGSTDGIVAPEGREEPSEADLKQFLDDWRKKADEKWEALLAERRGKKGLATGDEVTPEDEADYQEGWAR